MKILKCQLVSDLERQWVSDLERQLVGDIMATAAEASEGQSRLVLMWTAHMDLRLGLAKRLSARTRISVFALRNVAHMSIVTRDLHRADVQITYELLFGTSC